MQKTAPLYAQSTPIPGPCPVDEEIAAYIDGSLSRAEWEQVTRHLASCESCYAVFTETARDILESAPPASEDSELDRKLVEFPMGGGRLAVQWGSIAAALLAGIGGGAYYQLLAPPTLVTSQLTAPVRGEQGLVENFWVGPTPRGGGEEQDRPFLDASFQLGVQLINLQVALEAQDSETAARSILPRIHQVLESQVLFSDLKTPFEELSGDLIDKPMQPATFEKLQRNATASRIYADETYLALGQWVETTHLAAAAHNASYFQQAGTRRFLRRVLWRDHVGMGETKLDPPTRASLEKISDVLSKGDLKAPDYAELRRQTEKILEIHYPET